MRNASLVLLTVLLLTNWILCHPWWRFRLAFPFLPCLRSQHPQRVTCLLWFLQQTASRWSRARRTPCRICSTTHTTSCLRLVHRGPQTDCVAGAHACCRHSYFSWAMSSFCGSVGMLASVYRGVYRNVRCGYATTIRRWRVSRL